jgi:hypothetical protein
MQTFLYVLVQGRIRLTTWLWLRNWWTRDVVSLCCTLERTVDERGVSGGWWCWQFAIIRTIIAHLAYDAIWSRSMSHEQSTKTWCCTFSGFIHHHRSFEVNGCHGKVRITVQNIWCYPRIRRFVAVSDMIQGQRLSIQSGPDALFMTYAISYSTARPVHIYIVIW